MKTNFVLLGLAAALLCGCGQNRNERVVKLEAKLVEMESRLVELETKASTTLKIMEDMNANQGKFTDSMLAVAKEGKEVNDNLQKMFVEYTNLHAAIDAQISAPIKPSKFAPPTTTVSSPKPVLVRGIPANVYNDIKVEAERLWRGNFEMQEYEIKKQVEAYRNLHP